MLFGCECLMLILKAKMGTGWPEATPNFLLLIEMYFNLEIFAFENNDVIWSQMFDVKFESKNGHGVAGGHAEFFIAYQNLF